jgi:tryptophanyl-tRNA synthetase
MQRRPLNRLGAFIIKTSFTTLTGDIKAPSRVLSGIQPTGIPHLGNYFGALKQWVQLQSVPNQEHLFMIADLHSITVPQNPKALPDNVQSLAIALLAMGIDPAKSVLFRQSKVPQHAELGWILFCRTPVSWLKRMHHWKSKLRHTSGDESAEEDEGLNVGLLSYPVLQAADILLYRATQVPVGEDQAQHLNLANMIAKSFNSHYKSKVFPIPKSLFGGCKFIRTRRH